MRRRQYLALTGTAATCGCLRLQDQTATSGGNSSGLSEGAGADREVLGTWSQYGYDTANTGATTEESGPTEDVAKQWHVTDNQPDPLGSSPPVVGGTVYIVTNGNQEDKLVWAIDATTGETRWQQSVSGVWKHSPVVTDGQLFCGTTSGEVVALDAETGAYNWQVSVEEGIGDQNHLTVANGVLYVVDESGRFYLLSTDDGSEIQRVELDERCFSGPAVANERAFVTTFGPNDPDAYPEGVEPYVFLSGDTEDQRVRELMEMEGSGTVHMISTPDGDVQWSAELPDFVLATPTVVDGTVYVGCWDGYLYAFNAADGTEQWRYELGTPINGSASVADGTVYVGDWDATLHAISTDGSQEWILPSQHDDTRITTKPAIADGVVYANETHSIIAVDTTGRRLWEFEGELRWFDESSPTVADGALFVCGLADTRTIDGEEETVGGLFKIV